MVFEEARSVRDLTFDRRIAFLGGLGVAARESVGSVRERRRVEAVRCIFAVIMVWK